MATVVLAAAGAALGGAVGGSVLGLSSAVIGRAVGASVGRLIDERLLGSGSEPVDIGRIDQVRIMGAQEGRTIPSVFGRMRIGGHVIWSTRYRESVEESGGSKHSGPTQRRYSYSVSLAIALCEGTIARVGRIWADGAELSADDLTFRVYPGDELQEPDALMEAVEGNGQVPAYRGLAYVVIEDLDLSRFGNRVPQFSFEVVRPVEADNPVAEFDLAHGISGVALMPGSGEYALATTPVHFSDSLGRNRSANVNSPSGRSDFVTSIKGLVEEMPGCRAASLIVSWFGDDLRAGECRVKPKVDQGDLDGVGMPWTVSGMTRSTAEVVRKEDGKPVYGGTPCDQSVVEAIKHLNEQELEVMFYPFLLMEQGEGNGREDPWSGSEDQPVLPWRGRITSSIAANRTGSPDGTAVAAEEVSAFFGTTSPQDFEIVDGNVVYSGPDEWSYRRFILHNAWLCKLAGGVESFCIGSEMRGLTQIRGEDNSFPAVEQFMQIASDVRSVLGSNVKLSYAADWSEYFGYHPQDGSGDVYFHLDPLWAHDEIDFIGIDNYMPLSDWREGEDHLDAPSSSIYDLEYLKGNVEGGEGYDWYYHSDEARNAQIRTPIKDEGHGEDWIWRYKDMRGWWLSEHHDRIGGERSAIPSLWVPQSKPFRLTEFGCAAVDKGTNQPNKFLDPKSSESALPVFSDGGRDEAIQRQYYAAVLSYWKSDESNPVSDVYGTEMLDLDHAYAWAWDARPYPFFPNNRELWSDAANYEAGHWLNGRTSARSLADTLREICEKSGIENVDVTEVSGVVRGYVSGGSNTGRAMLQSLLIAYGIDAFERDGVLVFSVRNGRPDAVITKDDLTFTPESEGLVEHSRLPFVDDAERVRIGFVEADGNFDAIWEEASQPEETGDNVAASELPLAMNRSEGRLLAERWLGEARAGKERIQFALPPSQVDIGAGNVVRYGEANYRVDRVELSEVQSMEATRVDPEIYLPARMEEEPPAPVSFAAPVPVLPVFLDLPIMRGDEVAHAPHIAVTATPWPGNVAVYSASSDVFELSTSVSERATIGMTETPLRSASVGVLDRGEALQVRLSSGNLSDADWVAVLNGVNRVAIGSGSGEDWEVFQFRKAELIADNTYLLSERLRGQFGTDAVMPDVWPEGSLVVLLDQTVGQVPLAPVYRNLALKYRIGPANRALDDPSYIEETLAFGGVGLRPYKPCHLRFSRDETKDSFTWIRRSRIEGDSWDSLSVPVGEEVESYLVRVVQDGAIKREEITQTPDWQYAVSDRSEDGVIGNYEVSVAQVSSTVGPGPFATVLVSA